MDMKKLVNQYFPDWPEWKQNRIQVVQGTTDKKLTAAMLNLGGKDYIGYSYCDDRDSYSFLVGAMIALRQLRDKIRNKRRYANTHPWIPENGTYYFTISVDTTYGDAKFGNEFLTTFPVMWTGDAVDYFRLSAGLVFRSDRDARKYTRRMELNGRHIKNQRKQMP